METFPRYWPLCGKFTGPGDFPAQRRTVTRSLMFSLICVWINGWENNREAGDLRRYRAHYDVIVMKCCLAVSFPCMYVRDRPSAGTLLTTELNMMFPSFHANNFLNTFALIRHFSKWPKKSYEISCTFKCVNSIADDTRVAVRVTTAASRFQGPLLLIWFKFNPNMD